QLCQCLIVNHQNIYCIKVLTVESVKAPLRGVDMFVPEYALRKLMANGYLMISGKYILEIKRFKCRVLLKYQYPKTACVLNSNRYRMAQSLFTPGFLQCIRNRSGRDGAESQTKFVVSLIQMNRINFTFRTRKNEINARTIRVASGKFVVAVGEYHIRYVELCYSGITVSRKKL